MILPYSNPKEQIKGCIKCNGVNGMIVASWSRHQLLRHSSTRTCFQSQKNRVRSFRYVIV